MKRFSVLLVCLFTVLFLSGCSSEKGRAMLTNEIYLLLRYDTASTSDIAGKVLQLDNYLRGNLGIQNEAVQQTIVDENGALRNFDFNMRYAINKYDDSVELVLMFADYYSFAHFNSIYMPAAPFADVVIEESLFFYERWIKMENPWKTIRNNPASKTHLVVDKFQSLFGSPEYAYCFVSDYRRTKINSDETVRVVEKYEYYFISAGATDFEDIEIFDRFANMPTWYCVAVGATIVFMISFYIVSKKRPKEQQGSDKLS